MKSVQPALCTAGGAVDPAGFSKHCGVSMTLADHFTLFACLSSDICGVEGGVTSASDAGFLNSRDLISASDAGFLNSRDC